MQDVTTPPLSGIAAFINGMVSGATGGAYNNIAANANATGQAATDLNKQGIAAGDMSAIKDTGADVIVTGTKKKAAPKSSNKTVEYILIGVLLIVVILIARRFLKK